MKDLPSTEERVWAVLSHLSALAFGMGILLPIVGWSEQKRKSKYASFQCLQALGYQSLGFTVWLLAYLVVFIGILVMVIFMSYRAESNGETYDPLAGLTSALMTGSIVIFLAIYIVLPIVAAVACALGRDFHYPLMGARLARYLGYPKTDEESPLLTETHEERWVAAMGHFSVIIVLWGLLAPLTAWVLQGKQNTFLKFQSIQTAFYQVFVNLLYFGGIVLMLAGTVIVFAIVGLEGDPSQTSPAGMAGLVMFLILLLIASGIILVVPLFHILGQWAGYRVLKGDNYQYPIVGKLVKRWMAKRTSQMPS